MHIDKALDLFITQLSADGRSAHTIGQYRRHLRLLARWIAAQKASADLRDVDHETIALFLASPEARLRPDGKPKQATAANALRTSLRCFFAYAQGAGYATTNAARLVRRARCGTPPPRALSENEQERLMEALVVAQGRIARRDHLLFHLLLATGVRIGSALALTSDDVDLDQGVVHLRHSKNDRREVVYLGRAIRDHLVGFLAARPTGPLFAGPNGCALTQRHVQRRLAYWLGRAGIERHASPHALRHSFAMGLYAKTRDLLLVQSALHHRSIASTLVYARGDEGRLRRALDA
jgi:site-specific recombinase XerD